MKFGEIAVAGSEEKLQFCRRYGADHGVNYRTDDLTARIAEITNGRGVDLIYDPVGGATAATALKSIVRNGRIAAIGLASGRTVPLDSADMMRRNYTAVGVLAIPHDDPRVEAPSGTTLRTWRDGVPSPRRWALSTASARCLR
jgi:NADPH:quinone reductase